MIITGRVIIDGVDVKSTYGAYVVDGGLVDVPCIPSMKSPDINDWYEHNGIEADLESPRCESAGYDVVFMMNGTLEQLESFMSFLRSSRHHSFEFQDIQRTVRLRLVSAHASGISVGLFKITLVLSDDAPLKNLHYNEINASSKATGLLLDGKDLCSYFLLLNGSVDDLFPEMKLKENKLHESDYTNGEIHSEGVATYERDDISFTAIMRSKSINSFWKLRDNLAIDLFKTGERTISYKGRTMRAYYKDCRSVSFSYYSTIWWTFVLTFGYIGE